MTEKRPRGRPKGTTINDGKHLDAVADLMVGEPSLKKTPAIAKVVASVFPEHKWQAVERRMLRSWNKTSKERLEAARERLSEKCRDERKSRVGVSTTWLFGSGVMEALSKTSHQREILREALRPLDTSSISAAIRNFNQMQRINNLVDPPALRQMRLVNEHIERITNPFGLRRD